jgi:SAM-dependent methyltransferase
LVVTASGVADNGAVDGDAVVEMSIDVEHASVFDVYDELLVPLCFQPFADDLGGRVDVVAGDVLVVGCGTGADTRVLATALPSSVSITASDVVPGMVERARRRGAAREVTWDVADALDLPYDDASFDVVVCQFAAMFFPDKAAAFAQAARVLRSGGVLELATWDRIEANDFGAAVADAMRELFPDDPPAFLDRMPYSYHEVDQIVADLTTVGLDVPAGVEHVQHRARAASADVVAAAFCGGTPLRDQLHAGDADRFPLALAGAARVVGERCGGAHVSGTSSALVASAHKP